MPVVLARLGAEGLQHDWYVHLHLEQFDIREAVVGVLTVITSLGIPLWLTTALLYLCTWIALVCGCYALAMQISGHRLTAVAASFIALPVTHQWTLGGNDLAASMFVPSMAAWAVGLAACVLFLRRHYGWTGLLLAAAAWLQTLVALQLAGTLALLMLLPGSRLPALSTRFLNLARLLGGFLIGAAYPVYRLVGPQLSSPNSDLWAIQAVLRNPHHYLPSEFSLPGALLFGFLFLLGAAAYRHMAPRRQINHTGWIRNVFLLGLLYAVVGFVGTELFHSLTIAKAQPFKFTVLMKLLAIILVVRALWLYLPPALEDLGERVLAFRYTLAALSLALFVAVIALDAKEIAPVAARIHLDERATPAYGVARWARLQTDAEATFIVPPSWSHFRTHAERAIVVNFKAFPYLPGAATEWYDRLAAVAPAAQEPRSLSLAEIDASYAVRSDSAIRAAAERYGALYAVRPVEARAMDEPVYRNERWAVYRVQHQ